MSGTSLNDSSLNDSSLNDAERVAVEKWFVRRGLPNLIHDYQASTDVFTRAAPLLALFWVFGLTGAFGDRFTGWYQVWAALVGALFLGAVVAGVNRLRGRRPLQVPDRVGRVELTAFVLAPAVLPVLLDNSSIGLFVSDIIEALGFLLLVRLVYGFGLLSIIVWALRHLAHQVGDIVGLMIRSLPLLLIFTMFLFMNAELWQVADGFTTPLFLAASGGLVTISALFVLFRLPSELENTSTFDSTEVVHAIVRGCDAPIRCADADPALAPALSRTDRINVGVLAMFTLGVQIGLVMTIVGGFYLAFGLVTVRPDTIAQWTVGGDAGIERLIDLELFGADIPLTSELLKVTGFLMAFTALQFTVSALTDKAYREEFFDDLINEIRQALAVRVEYLHQIGATEHEPEQP